MPSSSAPERWDVFCRVVDNFGDVGVSWRIARQLSREHGKAVRLWLDDLTVLAKLRPEVDPARDDQRLEEVQVARIRERFEPADVADVVVETFGCDPPENYVLAMAGRAEKPRWINLEYLSAEAWVEGSHALPSPNPRLPLTKHYFFPGFTARTGGLLREGDLFARRDEFQRDTGAQAAFWRSLVGKAPPDNALKVSLFSYTDAPVESLAHACRQYPGPVWLVAAEGAATAALRDFGRPAHDVLRRNNHSGGARRDVQVFPIPFLEQDRYDQLLWACDVNFVRGEDSFVRAQWAGRPFVWNIYPTDDGAHWLKMGAFLSRYTASLGRAHAGTVAALWEAWNRRPIDESSGRSTPPLADSWAAYVARLDALRAHARDWAERLRTQRDLADQLVDFVENALK
ncbi:MAG TPA: elongation factor P maturation arginine rhamnosyltransferase EarP [Usitatibacter sp.]|nr:elongation factor P maturation arginine rhamnosyltransferase EarP [Usitatibacter sp.]